MNNEKLSTGKIISISLMLFAMFFGAGNMIFPPMLGHLGGENFLQAIFGFVVTDAGLSILGIAAIVLVGTKLDDLAGLVGSRFSILAGMVVYLLIGPLFALPRTGTVSYELAAITLVLLSFAKKIIGKNPEAYALAMLFAFIVGVFDGLKTAHITLGAISQLVSSLPLFGLGIGWLIPAVIGCLIGMLPFVRFLSKKEKLEIAK